MLWRNNRAGFGGIIRDCKGLWVVGFSGSSDTMRMLHTELLAIRCGLQVAWTKGIRRVYCETDCMDAFLSVSAPQVPRGHIEEELLQHIHELVMRNWCVYFSVVLREANTCADFLARHGAMRGLRIETWLELWDELANLMLGDTLWLLCFSFCFFFVSFLCTKIIINPNIQLVSCNSTLQTNNLALVVS